MHLEDLQPGMEMEGTVRNVTSFGAFVDIGVHEDGLVHISQLADRFVKDPNEIVHVGQVVRTRILEVDPKRKRIALTMRSQTAPEASNRSADRKNRRLPKRR
ncbi:S1 RNA-binding domain-containing protein [Allobaculum sp. Allo2]|uniref:S1 RNA-binding domain-containing protein n=1 Tax=Allobaculum sp. Allo2 TaxID=2853432 RepID=UPI001F620905|nr:S1 RNA-binding domain-containing protein [Allobaculum sp. Allo2]UNT94034.1 S1 RNA-binding domain-containing protein [Allobaculum sp. Allo2]